MQTTVLVSTFPGAPFSTLSLSVPSTTPFESLCDLLRERYPALPPSDDLYLSRHSGGIPPASTPLSSLCSEDEGGRLVSLRLSTRLLGGKGGFGSQLRAAGGRMSSQKTSNNDSCRDLSGRRLSTIKEAKKLAEYMESEPDRKKVAAEQAKAKLEALEKKIAEPNPGAKRRFDDTEYMEQTREIADGVKSAVAAGLLKKRKKAKTSPKPESTTVASTSSSTLPPPSTSSPTTDAPTATITETIVSSPVSAPIVAAASVGLGVASA